MIEAMRLEIVKTLTSVRIRPQEDIKPDEQSHVENVQPVHASTGAPLSTNPEPAYVGNGDVALAEAATREKAQPVMRPTQKVGRNDPCPWRLGEELQALPRETKLVSYFNLLSAFARDVVRLSRDSFLNCSSKSAPLLRRRLRHHVGDPVRPRSLDCRLSIGSACPNVTPAADTKI